MGTNDIATQIDIAADPGAVYRALTTTDGVAGWWTTHNETSGRVGEVERFWFPDAPISWDLRVEAAEPGKLVAWHCVGGPPPWIGTDVTWTLEPADEGGTRVVFDHTGFAAKDEMFRIVTLGWVQMLLKLKENLETGRPVPYFRQ
jgi:uncharacterized protein YndB with AHSA1/START domain